MPSAASRYLSTAAAWLIRRRRSKVMGCGSKLLWKSLKYGYSTICECFPTLFSTHLVENKKCYPISCCRNIMWAPFFVGSTLVIFLFPLVDKISQSWIKGTCMDWWPSPFMVIQSNVWSWHTCHDIPIKPMLTVMKVKNGILVFNCY